jgi:hypothetical protein
MPALYSLGRTICPYVQAGFAPDEWLPPAVERAEVVSEGLNKIVKELRLND